MTTFKNAAEHGKVDTGFFRANQLSMISDMENTKYHGCIKCVNVRITRRDVWTKAVGLEATLPEKSTKCRSSMR